MQKIIDAAMRYASLGWRMVPLHGIKVGACTCSRGANCTYAGKHPRLKNWGDLATSDEDDIAEWIDRFEGGMNLGILLGKRSGVVDVEYDSQEGARVAEALLGSIATPTYKSSRGKHRLFKWDDALPDKAVVTIDGLEIRTGGGGGAAQSVIPPSVHRSGATYQWLQGLDPDSVDVAPLPDSVLAKLANFSEEEIAADINRPQRSSASSAALSKTKIKEGERNDLLYRFACAEANRCVNLDDEQEQRNVTQKVLDRNFAACDPPLDDVEVKNLSASAIRFVLAHPSEDQQAQHDLLVHYGLEYESGEYWPGSWKLVMVKSDPNTTYRLVVPSWVDSIRNGSGSINFETPSDIMDANRVCVEVLNQTGHILLNQYPGYWRSVWLGTPPKKGVGPRIGLLNKLMQDYTVEDASPVDKLSVAMCDYLMGRLSRATPNRAGDVPFEHGGPSRMSDGSIWFSWDLVWEDGRLKKGFGRQDISRFSQVCGINGDSFKQYKFRDGAGGRKRFCVLSPDDLDRIQSVAKTLD